MTPASNYEPGIELEATLDEWSPFDWMDDKPQAEVVAPPVTVPEPPSLVGPPLHRNFHGKAGLLLGRVRPANGAIRSFPDP